MKNRQVRTMLDDIHDAEQKETLRRKKAGLKPRPIEIQIIDIGAPFRERVKKLESRLAKVDKSKKTSHSSSTKKKT